jgi:hypothetical protein
MIIVIEPIAKLLGRGGYSGLAVSADMGFCKFALGQTAEWSVSGRVFDRLAVRCAGATTFGGINGWGCEARMGLVDQSQELVAGQCQDAEHQMA